MQVMRETKNARLSRSVIWIFPRVLCAVALVASAVLAVSAGCAAGSRTTDEGGSDYYAIEVDSVSSPSSYNDGYELVRSVRPAWFREAGNFTVYLGEVQRSDVEAALRETQVQNMRSVRFYRQTDTPPNYVSESSLPALVVELR